MTLLKRNTLINRPEIVERADEKDDVDKDDEDDDDTSKRVDKLGDGGGPTVHGVEFEEEDLDVIAGANTAAVLVTGQDSGKVFEQMFTNAAIQLKELKSRGADMSPIVDFGVTNSFATVGTTDEQASEMVGLLAGDSIEKYGEPEELDDSSDTAENDSVDEVEEDIDDIKGNEETAE